jgi:hypothetical protein
MNVHLQGALIGVFEEAVLRTVNLVDDADTTGQLAGVFWGESQSQDFRFLVWH